MANTLESDLAGTTCQMCTELYTDPLLLPCLHSYCKKCLVKFNEKQDVSDGSITCPSCDHVSKIPSDGVEAFPQNLWLAHHVEEERCREKLSGKESMSCQRCVSGMESGKGAIVFCCECCKFLCSTCKNDHQQAYDTLNHKLVEVGEKKENVANAEITIPRKKQNCSQHGEELRYFCETCQEMVCHVCVTLSADNNASGHKEHKYGYYKEVAKKGCSGLQTSLQGCDEVITVLDDDIGNCEKMVQRIQTRKKEVDSELDNVHRALSKALDDRFKVLKNTNAKIANDKIDSIGKQVNMFTQLKSQASRGRAFVNLALKTHESSELLNVKKSIEGLLQQSKSSFKELSHEPVEIDNVETSLKHLSLSDQIAKFGHVSLADPALCSIVAGAAVPLATVGRARNFSLVLKNSCGAVKRAVPLQVVLKSSNGREIPVTISTKGGPSKPTLTFTPDTAGEHELSIMVTGTHIQGSPYRMWVRQERNLANVGGVQANFNVGGSPYGGVAVHHNGDVYCCNNSGHCVCVFDKNGTKKTTIGSPGSGNGQFNCPRGLVIVGDILYVADYSNHRVQKFTLTGEYVGQFGSNGSGDGQFKSPRGITHDGRGHVIVADYSNHRIQIFQLDGVHVRSIDCDGSYVYGVAVDNDGNIHVPLHGKNIVQVYSFDDEKLTSYSNTNGYFNNPTDIFIDDNGYRYIMASYYNRNNGKHYYYLHILDTEGKQVNRISVNNPQAVTLDTEGYIYVAESSNNRVSKY